MNLLVKLSNLARHIDREFEQINYGGYAVFAVIAAKELKKYGVWPKIIMGSYGYKNNSIDVRDVAARLHDISDYWLWNDQDLYFCHLGVEFHYHGLKFYFDSNGVRPADGMLMEYEVCPGYLRLSWAETIADNPLNWNRAFNREEIPEIEKITKEYLDPTFKKQSTKSVKHATIKTLNTELIGA